MQLYLRALLINIKLLDEAPIVLINKNKEFPEYPDINDPFLN